MTVTDQNRLIIMGRLRNALAVIGDFCLAALSRTVWPLQPPDSDSTFGTHGWMQMGLGIGLNPSQVWISWPRSCF